MAETIRWGIIGTGGIASTFAHALSFLPDAQLLAVGSRSQSSADEFAGRFGIPRRYPTYEALVNDPEVQAIYISTPHPYHYENALLCLNAGKAVLCEKPFALNTQQAAEMIRVAREKKVFLMEAMWTRFQPIATRVRELLSTGAIGDVQMLTADFGFRIDFDPKHRLFNPDLGGGALLDVGIYPISYAYMVLGKPSQISSTAQLGSTGVDEQSAYLFSYPNGQIAQLSSAVRTKTPHEALIVGTKGSIRVHGSFWKGEKMTLAIEGQPDQVIELPFEGSGYTYEATAVMNDLRAGRTENAIMPLDETLTIMGTLDEIRGQWGMKYPGE